MRKAIIIIPGIAGSRIKAAETFKIKGHTIKKGTLLWIDPSIGRLLDGEFNHMLLALSCDSHGLPMYPTQVVHEREKEYGTLFTYLELVERLRWKYRNEYDVVFFAYDWRLSAEYNADKLAEHIRDAHYDSVILIGHSMGGCIAMRYMRNAPLVEKLITVGTPFWGAPQALYTFETGNFLDLFVVDYLIHDALKTIANNFISVYELLPTQAYFGGYSNHYVNIMMNDKKRRISTYGATMMLLNNRSWAQNKHMIDYIVSTQADKYILEEELMQSSRVHAICGTGIDCVQSIDMLFGAEGQFQGLLGTGTGDGDGIVPVSSASMGGKLKNIYLVSGLAHSNLISSRKIETIIDGVEIGRTI